MIEIAEILVILVVFVLVGYIPQRKGAEAMKLTRAQIKALQAVEQGRVQRVVHPRISGARPDVIERLVRWGVINAPIVVMPKDSPSYTLTALGRAALEELRKEKE